jgi:hypothetical protein
MIFLPLPVFITTFLVLSLAAWLGATRFEQLRAQASELSNEFGVIQGATLTLLGLIVGFTFSMALDRYEQRKGYEAAEANAIATELMRAELLSEADAASVRQLLLVYLDQRIAFFASRDLHEIQEINSTTDKLAATMWAAVRAPAKANPSSVTTAVATGMNDVLNARGDTQAAWSNRIPSTAWLLMGAIAVCATMLVGIGLKRASGFSRMLAVLPLVIAIAFFLIADIESPRLGIIRVVPDNLVELAQSLRTP